MLRSSPGPITLRAGLALLASVVIWTGCRAAPVPDPEKRLAAGWEHFAQGDFPQSVKDFDAVLRSIPADSPLRPRALYGLATAWDLRRPGDNPELAARLYRDAIEANPGDELAAWSLLALARMPLHAPAAAVTPPDAVVMDKAYQEVIDRFPFSEPGEQAFLLQQAARLESSRPDQARVSLAALDSFLQSHPKSPYTSGVWRLIEHACVLLNLPERKLEAVLQGWKTAEIDPLNPGQELALTYWHIATIAEFDVGDFGVAREYYRKLIDEYPTEQRVFLAKQELKRMDELEARLRAEAAPGKGAP